MPAVKLCDEVLKFCAGKFGVGILVGVEYFKNNDIVVLHLENNNIREAIHFPLAKGDYPNPNTLRDSVQAYRKNYLTIARTRILSHLFVIDTN